MGTQPLVLVADDEPRITKLVSIALSEEGFRVVTATGGRGRPREGGGSPPRHRPARHRDAGPRRHRGHAPAPRAAAGPGHPAHGEGRDGRQGQGPRPRAPTTTSPSRSTPTSSRPASARSSAARPASSPARASSRSTTSRSTSSGGWSAATASWSSSPAPSGCCSSTSPTHPGKVVLHTELLTKVWGPEYRDDLQYLRVWISRVRRKLGAKPGEPGRIKTFQGIGYLLDVEPGGGR